MGTGEWAHGAALRDELAALHARIAPRFARPEARERAGKYLAGLLDPDGRRTGWGMAERIGGERPDGAQRLLNAAKWDAGGVRDDLMGYVLERLGDPSGALVLAETGFRKKGRQSVGVAPQRNPTTEMDENCQVALFLAYASSRGWACIDRALYLPEDWTEDRARRRRAGVPTKVSYAPKGELARRMLERALGSGAPGSWVTGGESCGKDARLRPLAGVAGPAIRLGRAAL